MLNNKKITPFRIKNLFLGFQLVSEDVSWWDAYGNLISVVSLFLSFVEMEYRYISSLLKRVPLNSSTNSIQIKIEDEELAGVPENNPGNI